MNYQPKLYIDLNLVDQNIRELKKDKEVCLMVKANQYGISEDIGPLVKLGYNFFGVSTYQEAKIILETFKAIKLLIVTPLSEEELDILKNKNVIETVTTIERLKQLDSKSVFHLKFDTAMGRIGFDKSYLEEIDKIIKKNKLKPNGIYSHFPIATNKEITNKQIKLFKEIVDYFNDVEFEYIHIQNTMGAKLYEIEWCNLIRPGIGIWGYGANREESEKLNLKPSLKLEVPIMFKKEYKGKVGYDLLDSVDGTVATIKIGYNDGLDRRARGYDFKEGKIVGNVCMCQTMVLLNKKDIKNITIFEGENIYQLCEYLDCITYELFTRLSNRIKREIIWQS